MSSPAHGPESRQIQRSAPYGGTDCPAMTTRTGTGARIPLEDMKAIIARALAGGDYEHDAEWARPVTCSCHAGAQSCLLPADEGSCQGYVTAIPTPPGRLVRLDIMVAALPEPDNDGTVDARDAALSVLRVITDRLAPVPYTLRFHRLRDRLVAAAEEYEQENGLTDSSSDVPEDAVSALRCQVCTKELPAGCKASRRTCSDACRQKLRRIRNASAPVTVTS